MAKRKPVLRVKFTIDESSSFEECNGESRPLTEAEYEGNKYRGCPLHPRAGSKVVNKRTKPPTVGCAVCGNTKYEDIPYAEYLEYYGNPEAHVYLGCIVEKQCQCCQSWTDAGSVWGIDFMIDSPEYNAINVDEWLTAAEARNLPGYAGEVAREQMNEAD